MREAADRLGLTVQTVEFDAQGMAPDGTRVSLPGGPMMLTEAFETEEGMENPPLNTGTLGFLFYEVDAITPSRQMPLDEVRDLVADDWARAERSTRLASLAEDVRGRIEAGETMAEIAEELELDVLNKYGLARTANDNDLGRDGVQAAFAVPRGATRTFSLDEARGHAVFTVTDIAQPLSAGPEAIDENTRSSMARGLSDDLLDQLVGRLQSVYPVRVNQNAIQQALSF